MTIFKASIPSPFLRYPTLGLLLLYYFATRLVTFSSHRYFDPLRLSILSPSWIPWIVTTPAPTQWLFIYSTADKAVPNRDVDEFVARARSNDLPVHTDIYNDTAHVSHLRSHPTQYTQQVKDHWQRAIELVQRRDS